jgi:hypothetical protein
MTVTEKWTTALAGIISGALASWGLLFLSIGLARGSLAIPFVLVATAAFFIGRGARQPALAAGLIIGAAVETTFFFYLFTLLP